MVDELMKQECTSYELIKRERTKQVGAKLAVCILGIVLLALAEALTVK